MAKLSQALYRLLLEYGDQVLWLHNPDRELIAMQIDFEAGRHTVCTDGRVSMGWRLSGLYGQDMIGRRCRAAFQADRDGVRVVIWPRDHSVEADAPNGEQQELPL
jgi:hypothetical protein